MTEAKGRVIPVAIEDEVRDHARKYGGRLTFVSDGNMHMEEFTIVHAQTGEELYSSVEK